MRSAVTISLVPEARGGPFIFWDDLAESCATAAKLGFDAVEIFPPSPDAIDPAELKGLLREHKLALAAVGTGAGWVKHKLRLTDPDHDQRARARDFARGMLYFAVQFPAPIIVGSMQGRCGDELSREEAEDYLTSALLDLADHAWRYNQPVLLEPLNRYETNLINTVEAGLELIRSSQSKYIRLLCDLFHMSIEEVDIAAALRQGSQHIGHLHLADSNRRPAGCGHTDFPPIAAALREINYQGFISAEALPYPSSIEAAKLTMQAYRKYFA